LGELELRFGPANLLAELVVFESSNDLAEPYRVTAIDPDVSEASRKLGGNLHAPFRLERSDERDPLPDRRQLGCDGIHRLGSRASRARSGGGLGSR
jgi:hypothetical protein